jgi:HlyD family secretion protein
MNERKSKLLRDLSIRRVDDIPPPRRRRWALALALVLAALAAGGGLWAAAWRIPLRSPGGEVASSPPSPPLASTPAVSEPRRTGSLIASGYVVARRKATIAAEITGKVVEVFVDEGNVVEAGQIVARLDSVLAEKDLALSRSRADAAEAAMGAIAAELRDAERIMRRIETLSQKNFASEADLTKAQAKVDVLRAQLRQAEAQLRTARLDAQRNSDVLDKHSIRAPFAGVVIDRSAQPGEMISPLSVGGFTRTGICTVVDMDSIEIEVDVNEAFIGRVRPGGKVSAVLDAYADWTIPASVIAIVPTANREKATVKVRIGLDHKDPRILPDMAAKVTFLDDGSSGAALAAEKSSSAN